MKTSVLPFAERVHQESVHLRQIGIDTVQINVGKLCNQACQNIGSDNICSILTGCKILSPGLTHIAETIS